MASEVLDLPHHILNLVVLIVVSIECLLLLRRQLLFLFQLILKAREKTQLSYGSDTTKFRSSCIVL
jgi:hypothetical protein